MASPPPGLRKSGGPGYASQPRLGGVSGLQEGSRSEIDESIDKQTRIQEGVNPQIESQNEGGGSSIDQTLNRNFSQEQIGVNQGSRGPNVDSSQAESIKGLQAVEPNIGQQDPIAVD